MPLAEPLPHDSRFGSLLQLSRHRCREASEHSSVGLSQRGPRAQGLYRLIEFDFHPIVCPGPQLGNRHLVDT